MPRVSYALEEPINNPVPKPVKFAVACLLLLMCLCKAVLHFDRPVLEDAHVYETAAYLVRTQHSSLIYDGSDTGRDPQLVYADPASAFATAARTRGIDTVRLYVYPPTLADLFSPMTLFSTHTDDVLWSLTSIAMLLLIALMVAEMGGIRRLSFPFAMVLFAIFLTFPIWRAFYEGQISIGLLFLWVAGAYCYWKRWIPASAALFALATMIKVYPGVIMLALFLWKEWRWLRWFSAALLGILGVCVVINGASTLMDFFRNVAPAMSNGILSYENRSLQGATELFGLAARGGSIQTGGVVPHELLIAGKAISAVTLCAFVAGLGWRRHSSHGFRMVVIALMALLASVLSPVSWFYTYSFAIFPLILLWIEAVQVEVSWPYFVLLSLSTLELTWLVVSYLFLNHFHGALSGVGFLVTPLSAMVLMYYRLLLGDRIRTNWLVASKDHDGLPA